MPTRGRLEPFRLLVLWVALLLVVYNPIEPWLLARLPTGVYWPLRLTPDALIAVLAGATLVIRAGQRGVAWWLLAGLITASLALLAADVVRGDGVSATVNAIRVLVRYPLIGLLVWVWVDDADAFSRRLGIAIIITGLVQIAAAFVEVTTLVAQFGLQIPPLAGTTGRYDRLGLLLAALTLLMVTRQAVPGRRRELVIISVALGLLYLSTSRQAALGLAVGAALLAMLPAVARRARGAAIAVSLVALFIVVTVSTTVPTGLTFAEGDDPGVGGAPPIPGLDVEPARTQPPQPNTTKGSSQLSIDPNRNFRIYLNLVVAPWAIEQQPLLGLGAGAHAYGSADPRLVAKVEADGIEWSFAHRFMNDSNYATLLIQFGLPATILFLGLFVLAGVAIAEGMRRSANPMLGFSVGLAAMVLVAAAFGPAFEMRLISSVAWIALFAALALISAGRVGSRDAAAAAADGGGRA